jgi:transketolase
MAASHFRLRSLVAIVDRNGLCIDGHTEQIMAVEPIEARFEAFGWSTRRIDGHDFDDILAALDGLEPAGEGKPQLIVPDTVKGRGVERRGMARNWHVGNLAGGDYDEVVAEIEAGLKPSRHVRHREPA